MSRDFFLYEHSATSRRGFTLIELLVVVTIIVVLLALLTPALDQAIYQAELAVCGGNLKGLGTSMIQYAAGNRRSYMYRYVKLPAGTRPNLLRIGQNEDWRLDDRPLLEQYSNLQSLVCPLTDEIRLDKGSNPNNPYIYTPVLLWAGWRYDGQRGMDRIGDKWTCTDKITDPNNPVRARYNLLASDLDWGYTAANQLGAAHPDTEGVLNLTTLQDEHPANPVQGIHVFAPHTLTSWEAFRAGQTLVRGSIDLNHAYDDGSVQRMDRVQWHDDRTRPVWLTSSETYDYSFWVPSMD
jgi:prepilin-type N-terminal cleavage/methylation domain-containing protein